MSAESRLHAAAPLVIQRRRFLQLAGFGVLGGAALGAGVLDPGAAHAADIDAITLGNRIKSMGRKSDWEGWCQAAQYWAEEATGHSAHGYLTARAALADSHIVSTSMDDAPAGSFSWYDRSKDGHVVTNLGNGYCINTSDLISSDAVLYDFGNDLRITTLADYPGPYIGWSHTNGVDPQIPVSPWSPSGGSGSSSWAFNPPSSAMQKRIQQALHNRTPSRYDGTIDGVWGPLSRKGIQTTCANVGYTGPIDGVPGQKTCYYVQVYAARFGGYTGPKDSVLGPNSWEGFAVGLEKP